MPTYEYRCSSGHHFEQFQRMADPPIEKCPVCGATAERLMSAGAGLLFKGSGFYITDYRSDTYKKAAEAESGKSDGKGKGGEKKSSADGKTGTKSETTSGSGDSGAKSSSSSE